MSIAMIVHPEYNLKIREWDKWRITYEGGRRFIDTYLQRLSKRETQSDFDERKAVTYCPAFAKVGVNEVKDSIYQRMVDITRAGGTDSYQSAITGLHGGVDLEGSSMNYFMGCKILPELLTMERVGIYVDMPPLAGESIAANEGLRPYIYMYKAEDIRSWILDEGADFNEYAAILLRENIIAYDEETGFPSGVTTRFRRIWRDIDGLILACFYDEHGEMIDQFGTPTDQPIILNINKIPFVTVSISESLLTDVADYQIALLNLASTDMSYALKSNFPFYTEQYEPRADSIHLRPTGNTTTPGQATEGATAKSDEIVVGPSKGRRYPKGVERPDFIHPSPEPLKASMEKQQELKRDIRQILKLTISNLQGPKMASAESKQEDSRSLETGLSYIGLALEMGERKIAEFWSMYEGSKDIATIVYPENYSLRTEEDRRNEAEGLEKLMTKVPSMTFQKEIGKRISHIMLGSRIAREKVKKIDIEIDSATTMTADPEIIKSDVEIGLLSLETASRLRGYPAGEVEKAKKDHAERLARIAEAQSKPDDNPGARGVPDASGNPKQDAKEEKAKSRDTTTDDVPTDKTRGEGK